MARQKTETTINMEDVPTPGLPAMVEALHEADRLSAIEAGYGADRDLLNQVIGEHRMAAAISKLLTVSSLSKLQYIKDSKLYRVSKGMKSANGQQFSGTWDDFCTLAIGKSRQLVDEGFLNLRAFGEDALDTMQQAGIGYRELSQYRKLPADERTALIEAAKDGDKDTLLDLAETLIAKHSKEKTDLSNQVSELTQNYEAQGKELADTSIAKGKLAVQLNARHSRVAKMLPDEVAKELRSQAVGDGFAAEHAIQHQLGATFKALIEHSLDNGGDHKQFMLGLVTQIEIELLKVREEFNLHGAPTTDDTPYWLKPESEEQKKIDAQHQAEWDAKMHSPEWANHPAAIAHKANQLKEVVN